MARGGRPQTATEARRDCVVATRLTVAERATVEANAAALGLSVADHLRAAVVDAAPAKRPRRVSSRPMMTPDELAACNRVGGDLRALGNNLNQIARSLNANAPRPVLDALAEELDALRRTRETLDQLFAGFL